jgi:Mn-dependent DtxR family transcriptional regulator
MNIDKTIEMVVLQVVYEAAGRRVGESVRVADVSRFANIDPATMKAAIKQLLTDGYLTLGATNDRVCVAVSGATTINRVAVASQ